MHVIVLTGLALELGVSDRYLETNSLGLPHSVRGRLRPHPQRDARLIDIDYALVAQDQAGKLEAEVLALLL